MALLKTVLEKAQQGDVASLEYVISEFSSSIDEECSKFGLWQLPDWSHSDLNQEVVIRVVAKLNLFQNLDSENLRASLDRWIRVTSRNVVKNLLRDQTIPSRKPKQPINEFDEQTLTYHRNRNRSASSIFMRDEEAVVVQTAIAECLDQEGAIILNLRIVEGLSLRQISGRLELSYDQVRYKFERSLAILKQRLSEQP